MINIQVIVTLTLVLINVNRLLKNEIRILWTDIDVYPHKSLSNILILITHFEHKFLGFKLVVN